MSRAGYDEWGNVLWEENPESLAQLIRLPGQQYDEETGLYYNRHRYYDALLGRHTTQDPIGWRGEWGLYTYPLNPLKYIDPLGLYIQNALRPFVCAYYGTEEHRKIADFLISHGANINAIASPQLALR
ncbi:RHS repeat-associated core domain-containing protein [Salmonella enterica subsp. salamae]|nr:RHS repeat-associated core domain-containing protein [Salmonella enterica subsp. salamae serovar 56:z10:e,n,x]EAQ6499240.1 RHS repeat-associated core domain-containing protein [Salmonella enterica]ECE6398451.1 RHS repeat-associated core domain-containing protein [Salmonella enterica subsp. salamae]ECJ2335306.1 RHS repeat-associated core domain-containing protein [Salmonella enterica subsp. salamae]